LNEGEEDIVQFCPYSKKKPKMKKKR